MMKYLHLFIFFFLMSCSNGTTDCGKIKITVKEGYGTFQIEETSYSGIGHVKNYGPDGFWKIYNANNVLLMEGHYKEGAKDGFWKHYSTNGDLKTEGHYRNCHKTGYWKFYTEKGSYQERWY